MVLGDILVFLHSVGPRFPVKRVVSRGGTTTEEGAHLSSDDDVNRHSSSSRSYQQGQQFDLNRSGKGSPVTPVADKNEYRLSWQGERNPSVLTPGLRHNGQGEQGLGSRLA